MTIDEKSRQHPLYDRDCERCGCPLAFVFNPGTGKRVVLDLRAQVYAIVEIQGRREAVRTELPLVSHFFTCLSVSPIKREV